MKKFCFVFFLLFVGISVASAQTQRGYVKTRGRLQSNGTTIPGTRLSGATVTLKGNKSVISGANGGFSFAVSNKSFCIINVRKNGYQIYDRDLLGKTHSYSSNDLLVVMDTPDNVLADKLASERKIRRTLQRQLTEKEDVIEKLYLHSDGAPIYKCYDTGELIARIACLVHMRRPFYKLKASFSAEEEPELLKAVNYALTEYPCMIRCLEDGSLDLSNNICERQIRRIAKYRNNSFFVGIPEAGVRFARLMSVFANIRNHKLDPVKYLCDVFRRIKNTAMTNLLNC